MLPHCLPESNPQQVDSPPLQCWGKLCAAKVGGCKKKALARSRADGEDASIVVGMLQDAGMQGRRATLPRFPPLTLPSFTQLLTAHYVCVNRGRTRYSNPRLLPKEPKNSSQRGARCSKTGAERSRHWLGEAESGPSRESEAEAARHTMCTKFEEDVRENL